MMYKIAIVAIALLLLAPAASASHGNTKPGLCYDEPEPIGAECHDVDDVIDAALDLVERLQELVQNARNMPNPLDRIP